MHAPRIVTCSLFLLFFFVFFFTDTAPTEIYTLSLHDALPIFRRDKAFTAGVVATLALAIGANGQGKGCRSEEHTSELQSPMYLVCRLLLEKKKKQKKNKEDEY